MNKDQIKGATNEVLGDAQKHLGRLVGSKEQEAKGLLRETKGTVQRHYGNAKDIIDDATDDAIDATRTTRGT